MIAFFFTIPMSRMMPMSCDDAQVGPGNQQGENCAHTGRWNGGENRERVNQALVEDAEHDVDRDKGRQKSDRARS
jgi:hypothetical protein